MVKAQRERLLRTVQEYFIYFMLYSFLGWCYEVVLEVFIYRWGYSDRGVLFGPYCVVYGFGAVLLLVLLRRLMERRICIGGVNVTPFLVFLGIVVITTVVELVASYVMELLTGGWTWDYRRFAFDFQGRIAPNPSFRFGVGGMVFLYVLQPLFRRLTDGMGEKGVTVAFRILAVILVTDAVFTFMK